MPTPKEPKKKPFDIDEAMTRVRRAVEPFARAAMFELHDEGYTSVFELLVGCIISIRTLDATVSTQPPRLAPASALGHADVNCPEATP